jgi:large subunit ribosomal protein L23
MRLNEIIKHPIVTEKANELTEKFNRYQFAVDRRANKLEIKKAIEEFYSVTIEDVNTCVMPGKFKSRYTKAGFLNGKTSAYKKATVTLAEGESIDLYAF